MKSPFQEEIVVNNYFATIHTEESLQAIHQAVGDGIPMLVLSGDEGVGKTMLCHKLDQDTEKGYSSVLFPQTVDSFEDVAKNLAFALDVEVEEAEEPKSIETILSGISERLAESGQPFLLIIDEAENIYLATLERVRKMLDRFTEEGGRLHVLFSGRHGFIENCNQLSMCDFRNTGEFHVKLEPLSQAETQEYLRYCSEKIPDFDGDAVFTAAVVEDMYKISQGNFRMTNILAEEAVQKNGDDTSFMVLLENVKEDICDPAEGNGPGAMIKEYFSQYKSYLPYGAAGVVLIAVAVFYLFSADRRIQVDKEQSVAVAIQTTAPESSATDPEGEKKKLDSAATAEVEQPDIEAIPEEPTMALDEEEQEAVEGVEVEEEPVQAPLVEETKQAPRDQVTIAVSPQEIVEQHPPLSEDKKDADTPQISIIEVNKDEAEKVKIVELYRNETLKKKPGKLPKTIQETIKPVREIEKHAPRRNEVQDVIASNAHFTAEQLYKKRIMAGSSWYNHKKDDKYTVQLMVLKSDSAEENFKEMLREDRYRQEAGNFFIFRKLATSNTLFVFYGEYASISQARLAQNSLPQFLRDHKPYAISVKGAMAKVRRR